MPKEHKITEQKEASVLPSLYSKDFALFSEIRSACRNKDNISLYEIKTWKKELKKYLAEIPEETRSKAAFQKRMSSSLFLSPMGTLMPIEDSEEVLIFRENINIYRAYATLSLLEIQDSSKTLNHHQINKKLNDVYLAEKLPGFQAPDKILYSRKVTKNSMEEKSSQEKKEFKNFLDSFLLNDKKSSPQQQNPEQEVAEKTSEFKIG